VSALRGGNGTNPLPPLGHARFASAGRHRASECGALFIGQFPRVSEFMIRDERAKSSDAHAGVIMRTEQHTEYFRAAVRE